MTESLRLKACKAGQLGDIRADDSGYLIAAAGVCFCFGKPNERLWKVIRDSYSGCSLAPMSADWEKELLCAPGYIGGSRYLMEPTEATFDTHRMMELQGGAPAEYHISAMYAADVATNPFGYGRQYRTPQQFESLGVGCAVRVEEKIVSAAASVLTLKNEVLVDATTLQGYRGKNLALACSAALMRLCAFKGLRPQWDARNMAARELTEKLGFVLKEEYTVFFRN